MSEVLEYYHWRMRSIVLLASGIILHMLGVVTVMLAGGLLEGFIGLAIILSGVYLNVMGAAIQSPGRIRQVMQRLGHDFDVAPLEEWSTDLEERGAFSDGDVA